MHVPYAHKPIHRPSDKPIVTSSTPGNHFDTRDAIRMSTKSNDAFGLGTMGLPCKRHSSSNEQRALQRLCTIIVKLAIVPCNGYTALFVMDKQCIPQQIGRARRIHGSRRIPHHDNLGWL